MSEMPMESNHLILSKKRIIDFSYFNDAKPGVEAVLDHFLAVLPPFVAIVQHIHLAPCLEAEPWLSQLPPHLHLSFLRRRCGAPPPARKDSHQRFAFFNYYRDM